MKRLFVLVFALAAVALRLISGQFADASQVDVTGTSSQDICTPASTNVIAARYRCIYPDRRIMPHFNASEAQHVQALVGGGGAQTPMMDMVKQAGGTWTLTTHPIVEGFHYYQFYVDGVEMNDPGSQTFFGEMRQISGIEIPSVPASLWALSGAPARHTDVCFAEMQMGALDTAT